MKKPAEIRYNRIKKVILATAVASLGTTAHAASMAAHGDYTQAKATSSAPTTGYMPTLEEVAQSLSATPEPAPLMVTAPVAPSAPVAPAVAAVPAAPIAKPVAKPVTNTVATSSKPAAPAQPKDWAKDKWTAVKSFTAQFFGLEKPTVRAQKNQPTAAAPVARQASQAVPAPAVPSASMPVVAAPVPSVPSVSIVNPPGLKTAKSGVQVYDMSSAPSVPRLGIDREERIKATSYAVEGLHKRILDEKIIHRFDSPELLDQKAMKQIASIRSQPMKAQNVKDPVFSPKGKVSREAFDKIVMDLKPELQFALKKFTPLTSEEMRFLSGLLLYHQGDKCPVAIGLFHQLAKKPEWQAEADYYSAMCSRKVGLETDFMERARRVLESGDVHYSRKLLKDLGHDIPYEFTESFGAALYKAVSNQKLMEGLDAKAVANIAYLLTEYGVSTEKYKVAQTWAAQVSASHPRSLQARFLAALAEYQVGSKEKALKMQETLINDVKTDKERIEFQALVALNVGRMYFQERQFKNARESLLKVYKDHPMWLTSLTEMGWSQLQSGDYEGAIGNMYSVQSPFFSAVYKPESYVIRTIGYLNLCQYGDAYRTLSILEHEYRPYLEKMNKYLAQVGSKGGYYQTLKSFLANKAVKEVDGLPTSVIREMARHRDFTNLQKALNRNIDERQIYARLDDEVSKALARAEGMVSTSQRRVAELRKNLESIKIRRDLEPNRNVWMNALNKELYDLEGYQFQMDLFSEAKTALPGFRKDVVATADTRIAKMKSQLDKILGARLARMKTDLARVLENNELLRYEVFAGSGENIRYQVAGGEKGNRVPASVMPKSKSLQWQFSGEYWEDEIGHYRSSLKNNCPDSQRREQARLDGGEQ